MRYPDKDFDISLLFVFVWMGGAIFSGLLTAILPLGLMVRFFGVLFGVAVLLMAWGFRNKINVAPESLLVYLVFATVSFSILWPRYVFFHFSGLPSVNLYSGSTLLSLYGLLAAAFFSPTLSHRVWSLVKRSGSIGLIIFIWFFWRFLTSLFGSESLYSISSLIREMAFVASYLLFGVFLASHRFGPLWLVRIILICGVLVGVAGIIEAVTEHNAFSRFASAGDNGDMTGTLANIALDKIRAGAYRAQSTFDHPIVFAQFVAALTPLAIYGLLRESSKFWRLVALIALPVALLAIAKSGSRAGIVSVLVAFLLIGVVMWLRAIAHGKISKVIAIFALPALLGGIGIGYLVLQELLAGRGQHEVSSSGVRLLMLKNGIAALGDSPLWGFGQGLAITKAGVVNSAGLATIDNYFLSIALDSGYVGLALFFLFLIVFIFKGLAFSVKEPGPDGLFVGACLASVLAIVATFAGLSIMNNMTLLWLLLTATIPLIGNGDQKNEVGSIK